MGEFGSAPGRPPEDTGKYERATFDAWFDAARAFAAEQLPGLSVEEIEAQLAFNCREAWRPFYDMGYSPSDAVYVEIFEADD